MELLQTLRKIRLCEDDAAAQLLLEAYVMQEVAAERDRCARLCERYADDTDAWRSHDASRCAAVREVARRIRTK